MARAATENDVDLDKMSDAEVSDLMDRCQAKLRDRVGSRLEELRVLARKVGVNLTAERFGDGGGRPRKNAARSTEAASERRREVTPKYRNPDNPAQIWSGRGKAPRWMDEKLKAGIPKERFLVQPTLALKSDDAAA